MPTAVRSARRPARGWVLRFQHTVPATLDGIERIHGQTMQVVRAMACAAGEEDKVDLALREALANALIHGSRYNPRKRVTVCCLCNQKQGMMLLVRDRGAGFDPAQVPDPTEGENIFKAHGRGIFIIRQMMDRVRHRRGGREIVMRKRRKSRS